MEFIQQENKLVLLNNDTEIGSATFVAQTANTKRLVHVFVDPQFRGQGLASNIVKECAMWAKQDNFKIVPICPYAVTWFARHPEYKNVLAK